MITDPVDNFPGSFTIRQLESKYAMWIWTLEEAQDAYSALYEDMLLWGVPEGLDRSHETLCELVEAGAWYVNLRKAIMEEDITLAQGALHILREARRMNPGRAPRGIITHIKKGEG